MKREDWYFRFRLQEECSHQNIYYIMDAPLLIIPKEILYYRNFRGISNDFFSLSNDVISNHKVIEYLYDNSLFMNRSFIVNIINRNKNDERLKYCHIDIKEKNTIILTYFRVHKNGSDVYRLHVQYKYDKAAPYKHSKAEIHKRLSIVKREYIGASLSSSSKDFTKMSLSIVRNTLSLLIYAKTNKFYLKRKQQNGDRKDDKNKKYGEHFRRKDLISYKFTNKIKNPEVEYEKQEKKKTSYNVKGHFRFLKNKVYRNHPMYHQFPGIPINGGTTDYSTLRLVQYKTITNKTKNNEKERK